MKTRENIQLQPFLKWAGGKRWLVSKYSKIFLKPFNTYFEPFLGSGAVFFHLKPKKSVLSDVNKDLIDTFRAIRNNWKGVVSELKKHNSKHSTNYYYKMRDWKPNSANKKAALFIYLNRTCWNALYRVNKEGKFNVPIGTKLNVLLETDDFEAVSNALKNVTFKDGDFEHILDTAKKGDFIYLDPPYTVTHSNNGFIKYNNHIFKWEDQCRLASVSKDLINRGCAVVISNAYHNSIFDLYKGFYYLGLKRHSLLAADPRKRGDYKECLFSSFPIKI